MRERDTGLDDAVSYRIDDSDQICYVSDGYEAFARDNDGAAAAGSVVMHRALWEFITDSTTQQLYRDVIKRVRDGRSLQFEIRCDSARLRRLLRMDVSRLATGEIEFNVTLLKKERRAFQPLLAADAPRSNELLRMCGWCKKVGIEGRWLEVEDAVRELRLFEQALLPQLTHGICEACCQKMIDTLERAG